MLSDMFDINIVLKKLKSFNDSQVNCFVGYLKSFS